MKNIIIKYLLTFFAMALTVLGVFSSCDKDESANGGGSPAITSVAKSVAGDLVPVTVGDPKNYYIIRGTGLSTVTKIYFNDFDTYFNPVLVTDTEIFVLIDEKTPYANSSNKLRVVTGAGTILYDFVVAPPTPKVNSFNSINAAEDEEVTIYGDYFLNPTVQVGTVDVPVISSTLTEIKFKMPANAKNKYVIVTNISGSTSSTEAVGTAIYDDAYRGMQWGGPWSGYPVDLAYKIDFVQGQNAIKYDFGGWNGLGMGFDPVDLTLYKSIRIAVKGAKTGTLDMKINGSSPIYKIPVTSNWATVEVKLSDLGNPTQFNELVLQESGNFGGNSILVDNIGFVLK